MVTLPIGVLKSGGVRFGPDLPSELTEAIERIGAGLVNKVALRFERAFWDDVQFIFSAEDSTRFPLFFNQNIFQPKGNVLVNYGLGNFAEIVDKRPIAELEAELMTRLREIYGSSAIDPVGSIGSLWRSDPYTKCSYSFATPSTRVEHFKKFEAVLGGRVVFAGEHTSAEYRATVHGAFLSGVLFRTLFDGGFPGLFWTMEA